MGVKYKISRKMYECIRDQDFGDTKNKKRNKPLNKKEVLAYMNQYFGLKEEIVDISII